MKFIKELLNGGELVSSAYNHFENALFIQKRPATKIRKEMRYGKYWIIYKDDQIGFSICEFYEESVKQEKAIEILTQNGCSNIQHGCRVIPTDNDIDGLSVNLKEMYC